MYSALSNGTILAILRLQHSSTLLSKNPRSRQKAWVLTVFHPTRHLRIRASWMHLELNCCVHCSFGTGTNGTPFVVSTLLLLLVLTMCLPTDPVSKKVDSHEMYFEDRQTLRYERSYAKYFPTEISVKRQITHYCRHYYCWMFFLQRCLYAIWPTVPSVVSRSS